MNMIFNLIFICMIFQNCLADFSIKICGCQNIQITSSLHIDLKQKYNAGAGECILCSLYTRCHNHKGNLFLPCSGFHRTSGCCVKSCCHHYGSHLLSSGSRWYVFGCFWPCSTRTGPSTTGEMGKRVFVGSSSLQIVHSLCVLFKICSAYTKESRSCIYFQCMCLIVFKSFFSCCRVFADDPGQMIYMLSR